MERVECDSNQCWVELWQLWNSSAFRRLLASAHSTSGTEGKFESEPVALGDRSRWFDPSGQMTIWSELLNLGQLPSLTEGLQEGKHLGS